jgi:DNA-binding Lrp family transcriptional regulator
MRSPRAGDLISTDERLVRALKDRGPQTLERLAVTSNLSWSELFFAVDRLSRSGRVTLKRIHRCEYELSLRGPA